MYLIKSTVKALTGFGKLRSQRLFESLYLFAAHGMNFGTTAVEKSGEVRAMQHVKVCLGSQPRPLILFDVGANVGQYSTALRQCFQDSATIYAFEPSAEAFAQYKENVPIGSHTHVYPFGFGDREETVDLYYSHSGAPVATVYRQKTELDRYQRQEHETVTLRTLDQFSAENQISRIDFLKVDVEGHELKVLEGARSLLEADAIQYIQFETSDGTMDARTYLRDFFDLLGSRYRIYRVVRDGLLLLPSYSSRYELFLDAVNYLAEHR